MTTIVEHGRKLLFAIGLVIFTLGSLLCGLADGPLMLIVSRSAQGGGGALMFATSLACWRTASAAAASSWSTCPLAASPWPARCAPPC